MAEDLSNWTVIEHIRYNDQGEERGEGKRLPTSSRLREFFDRVIELESELVASYSKW